MQNTEVTETVPSTRSTKYQVLGTKDVVDKLLCCDQSYTIGGERGRWYNRVLLAPLGSGFLPVVCPGCLLCCTWVVYLGHFEVLWCTSTYFGVPGVMYLALHCGVPGSLHRPEL